MRRARGRCLGAEQVVLAFTLAMPRGILVELSGQEEFDRLRLPAAVDQRLQELLYRQDRGEVLTEPERTEAQGLVDLAEFLTLLRLRAEAFDTHPG